MCQIPFRNEKVVVEEEEEEEVNEETLLVTLLPIDHLPRDVTHTQKFDYYSTDHTWGGYMCFKRITFYGENPTSTHIPVRKLHLGIAIRDRPALFVEQRALSAAV